MPTIDDWGLRTVDVRLAARYVAEGLWTDESLGELLGRELAGRDDLEFVVHSDVRPWRGSFAEVDELARRVAAGLRARGVQPGDRVAFQTPNWLEGAATFYAACYLGAIVVPIVHFYGPKEVAYILERSGVKAFVTADRFGAQDYLANREQWKGRIAVDLTVVVGDGPVLADAVAFAELATAEPIAGPEPVDADARAHRVHVGHHVEPQGRGALAPHDQRRDPPAREHAAPQARRGGAAGPHRRADRPRHRHARRAAAAGVAR